MTTEGPPTASSKKGKKAAAPLPVLQDLPGPTKQDKLQQLYQQWYGCQRCQLWQDRRDPNGSPFDDVVFGEGNPDAKIMIVGEAPGEEEEQTSIPFVGPSGRLLNQIIATVSDDQGIRELYDWYNSKRHNKNDMEYFHERMLEYRKHEYFVTNVVACRPQGEHHENRAPATPELKACFERLYNLVYIVDPVLIIACGKYAMMSFLKHKQIEITKVRGTIYDSDIPGRLTTYRKPVMAALHPSYLLRQADWREKNGTYANTLLDFLTGHRFVDRLMNLYQGTPIPERINL